MYGEIMHLRFAGESARAFAKSARKEVTPNHNASAAEKNREIPNPVRTQKMREGGGRATYTGKIQGARIEDFFISSKHVLSVSRGRLLVA